MRIARTVLCVALLVGAFACARSVKDDIGENGGFSQGTPDPNAACVQTECPAPHATCPGETPCAIDLSSDVNHCGSCDTPCPDSTKVIHGTWLCSDSQCKLACDAYSSDCNQNTKDGCEVDTFQDPKNCGGCGVTCKAGDPCWKGACGCPSGFAVCGNKCVDIQSDNDNCGACDQECKEPKLPSDPRWICGPNVNPENTEWTCSTAACSLQCKGGFGDCNMDFCADGCEIDFLHDDKNCGSCGNACGPNQWCNLGTCSCPPGTTRCHDRCVDTQNDPDNCGSCGGFCDGPTTAYPGHPVTGGPLCIAGQCQYVCKPGFADCNKNIDDGCEADLNSDQKNCGACGVTCNIALGQPCFQGQCLTKTCEGKPGPN